jgi:hypothetical protein
LPKNQRSGQCAYSTAHRLALRSFPPHTVQAEIVEHEMSSRMLCIAAAMLVATLGSPIRVLGQTSADSAGVRRAALDYVEGFYEGDSTKHVRSVRPDVYKYGFWLPRDSTRYQGEQMPWAEFLSYTRRMRSRGATTPANAPKQVQLLDLLDQTAAVKVTASWGTDYLLLGKYDGRWMVSSVLWQSKPKAGP